MTARSEELRQPRPLHAGAWLLVASVLVAAALVMAFVLTRSGSTPTTGTKPPIVVTSTYFQDAGPTGRACEQWGECGSKVEPKIHFGPMVGGPDAPDWKTFCHQCA
jgi:hypothetical protein